MAMERVDVRVESEILEELEDVAQLYGINNRSEAIREAIYDYIEDKKEMWNSEVVKVSIPRALIIKARKYIKMGEVEDLNQAVFASLTIWCKEQKQYYLHERDKLDDIAKEMEQSAVVERDGRRRAKRFGRR
ncbi:MAG: ribbon-helix-helix protein, CopG family [Thermoplasmata archaeon]|nr:ribbon-helix-helix protein, CopG family [Thermoplasmata archaeon]